MKTVNQSFGNFQVIGVKPGFNLPDEDGKSAFETINEKSFPGKWKIVYFYPKDFTFVCPTEIVEYNKIVKDLEDRDAVLMGGSPDNEFVKLAWRREHKDLNRLGHWQFADVGNKLGEALGIIDEQAMVPLRATFIIDPDNIIRHITVNTLDIGRNAAEALRVLDALQTGELCPCNRPVGGSTL